LAWAISVDQYAERLLRVLEDVEIGFPVKLRLGATGPPSITVTERPVILGHPRADQQAAFEQRILVDFCSINDCRPLTQKSDSREAIAASPARVNPVWTFSAAGATCVNEGVEVVFRRTPNMAILRGLCEEMAAEVTALLTALAGQKSHGVAIDWQRLSITSGQNRNEFLVTLNIRGDSVLLDIPILFGSEGLLQDLSPWLQARLRGKSNPIVSLDAASYGWIAPGS
jgi:hypothetical protein